MIVKAKLICVVLKYFRRLLPRKERLAMRTRARLTGELTPLMFWTRFTDIGRGIHADM